MARRGLFGSLLTVGVAVGAAAGIAYLFRDEIRNTEKYKQLNEKYDVDTKIRQAADKAKDTAYDLKDKAKDTAFDLKDMAVEKWNEIKAKEEDIIDEDELFFEDGDEDSAERDYVTINPDEVKEAAQDKVEEVKDAVQDKTEEFEDAVEKKLDDVDITLD